MRFSLRPEAFPQAKVSVFPDIDKRFLRFYISSFRRTKVSMKSVVASTPSADESMHRW